MRNYTNSRNPVLPVDIHIPDSEAHVMPDGKLYIYGSFDCCSDVYCSTEYHVVSTSDMINWTVHDTALKGEEIPWFNNPDAAKYPGIDWSHPTPFIRKILDKAIKDGNDPKKVFEETNGQKKLPLLFAPDCVFKDGKYYLYFCMSDDSEGVAVSETPEGPFKNPVQLPIGGIDPAVFRDDDGQYYLYWGQLFSHGVKLHQDIVSFDSAKIADNLVTEEEHFFHEGSSMRRIGDTYYYIFADMQRGKPTSLGYATAQSPLGPFTYRGIIIDNEKCDSSSWNNHGSIECVNGQWYVFYHRCSLGSERNRRLCIEPIHISEDGTIPEVKMTSQGAGKPFEQSEKIMGYQACEMQGNAHTMLDDNFGEVLSCRHSDKKNVQSIEYDRKSSAVFRYFHCLTEIRKAAFKMAGYGICEIFLNGTKAGEISIVSSAEQWKDYECLLRMPPDDYEIELRFSDNTDMKIAEFALS